MKKIVTIALLFISGSYLLYGQNEKNDMIPNSNPPPIRVMEIADYPILYKTMQKEGKWGLVDSDGKEVIPIKYTFAEPFSEGKAKVIIDGKEFYIDKTGKEIKVD